MRFPATFVLVIWAVLTPMVFAGEPQRLTPAEEEQRREAARQSAREALMLIRQQGVPTEDDVDDSKIMIPPDEVSSSDRRIHFQHFVPGYGTERNQEFMETLEGIWGNPEACGNLSPEQAAFCMESNASTPAEIQRLAEDHNEQLRSGTNPESQAFQMVEESAREQPRVQFWNPDDDFHDPIFDISLEAMNIGRAVHESLIGDCDYVEIPVYEREYMILSDIQTCHQVFAPEPNAFECSAERRFSAIESGEKMIARITPLVANPICEDEAAQAAIACNLGWCSEAADLRFETCQIREGCGSLEGQDLDDCLDSCQVEAEGVEQQCSDSVTGCSAIEAETFDSCMLGCELDPGMCAINCERQARDALESCDEACDSAGQDAYGQCFDELGSGVFEGILNIDLRAIGTASDFVISHPNAEEILVESTPFSGNPGALVPDQFVANYAIQVDGGDGQILTYAGPSNSQQARVLIAGTEITEARIFATLYSIQENRIDGCEEFMDALADNFCTGTAVCTDPSPNCYELAPGIQTCGSGASAPLVSVLAPWHSASPLALQLSQSGDIHLEPIVAPRTCASALSQSFNCEFFLGAGEDGYNCYIDMQGIERCIVGDGSGLEALLGPPPYLDNCSALELDPSCGNTFQSVCVEDGDGPVSGRCYINEVRYECGDYLEIDREIKRTRTISCEGGQMICLGDECYQHTEAPGDFQKAVEATAVLREMERDFSCFEEDDETTPYDLGTECTPVFFRGEAMECKIPVGSNLGVTPNCCKEGRDSAAGEGFSMYMDAMTAAHHTADLPGFAWEQSFGTGIDESGAHLNTPDWEAAEDETEYSPPGGGGDGGGRAGLHMETRFGAEGQHTASSRYIDPDSLQVADPSFGVYVSRPFVSPFEVTSAQAGFVPSSMAQLGEAKLAARGEGGVSFARAVGIGAQGFLSPGFYEQLYFEDGTPRWVRARNGSIIFNSEHAEAIDRAVTTDSEHGGGVGEARFMPETPDITSFASIAKAVSTAYAAYNLTRLVGHMIFQCEQEELDLGHARETRRCSYVGSYCRRRIRLGFIRVCIERREVHCCFNSAFARIFAEQMRKADPSADFGTAKEPNCEGYDLDTFRTLDMTELDLSEWFLMEHTAGRYPTGSPGGGRGAGLQSTTTEDGRTVHRITVSPTSMLEHYVSPRRGIPGSHMSAAGPQGMVSVEARVANRASRNFQAMEATRNRLSQAGTQVFHSELMPWYAPTTSRNNPPRNLALQLPDNLGDKNEEELPGFCDSRQPPTGWVRVTTDYQGVPLDQIFSWPEDTWQLAMLDLAEGQFAAIEAELPRTGRSDILVFPGWNNFVSRQVSREGVVTISRCPGDFTQEAAICYQREVSMIPPNTYIPWYISASSGNFSWSCPSMEPGRRVFINIASRLLDPIDPGCPGNSFCGLEVQWSHQR